MVAGLTKLDGTFTVIVNDILKPFAKVPRLQVRGDPEQEIELELNVVPAGRASVTTTLVALSGPRLVTPARSCSSVTITCLAPWPSSASRFVLLRVTAIEIAPAALAICIAASPTEDDAAVMITASPGASRAMSIRAP